MFNRLSTFFRHVVYNLRGGFLVRPLAIALVLGVAGAILSTLEEMVPALQSLAPQLLFPSHDDPQVAQVILGTIAGLLIIAAGALGSWRVYASDSETPARKLVAIVSLLACALYAIGTVLPFIAAMVIPGCWR